MSDESFILNYIHICKLNSLSRKRSNWKHCLWVQRLLFQGNRVKLKCVAMAGDFFLKTNEVFYHSELFPCDKLTRIIKQITIGICIKLLIKSDEFFSPNVKNWESSRVSTSRIHIFFSLSVCLCVCPHLWHPSSPFPPLSISSPSRLIELHFGLPHCRGGQRSMKYGESEMVSARWWRQDCDGEREKARWWYGEIVTARLW